jgi:GNAT superfamily N-acetyltransferase
MSSPTAALEIRTAAPGDGSVIAVLARLALGTTGVDSSDGLPAAIDDRGGRIKVPHGEALCLVAEDAQGSVTGMVYKAPPVAWIEQHPAGLHHVLARAFAKIELLAVLEEQRRQGTGSKLLAALEQAERDRGVQLLFAGIAARDRHLRSWYKRRGYTIAAPGEPVVANSRQGPLTLVDVGDGYLVAAKALQPQCRLSRTSLGNGATCLVIERAQS